MVNAFQISSFIHSKGIFPLKNFCILKSDSNFDKNDNKRTGSFIIEKAGTVAAGGMAQFG